MEYVRRRDLYNYTMYSLRSIAHLYHAHVRYSCVSSSTVLSRTNIILLCQKINKHFAQSILSLEKKSADNSIYVVFVLSLSSKMLQKEVSLFTG